MNIGDRVKHVASGEIGVITNIKTRCTNPKHTRAKHTKTPKHLVKEYGECDLSIVEVTVVTGFACKGIVVDPRFLELV